MNPESSDPRRAADEADKLPSHLCLSALADGDADALVAGCALWRDEPDARRRWHSYHLIGDVLRSDELASQPSRDAAFLAGLRARLAREPVPLAPASAGVPLTARTSRTRRLGWRAPAAVAAGFCVVAGVLVLTRLSSGTAERAPALAVGPGTPSQVRATAPPEPAAVEPRLVLSGGQLRDPLLDAYLRAHQAARGGAPAALPGGALRSVEMVAAPAFVAAAPAGGTSASGAGK